MSESVNLPALGESVTEGTVTRWLKNVGDRVEVDEPLLEVSTDKVDTEIPSPVAGVIEEILVAEDETVEVGTALVTIGDGSAPASAAPAAPEPASSLEPAAAPQPPAEPQSEPAPDPAPAAAPAPAPAPEGAPAPEAAPAPPTSAPPASEPAPAATPAAPDPSVDAEVPSTDAPAPEEGAATHAPEPAESVDPPPAAEAPAPPAPAEAPAAGPSGPAPASPPPAAPEPVASAPVASAPVAPAQAPAPADPAPVSPDAHAGYVTPIVRKLANDRGVNLDTLTGTGVGGRIRKQDVLDATPAETQEPAAAAPSSAPVEVSPLRGTTVPMSRLRKVIAERAVISMQSSAQLTSVVEVDVTLVANYRARVKDEFLAKTGVKLSFLPFFALAAAEALQAYPIVNATIDGDTIVYPPQENISIAVDTERGLLTPVIRDASRLDLAGIAGQIADLAARTRDNKLKPDELAGGTFTLTNTGSRGALFDTPIVFLPQSAILGTGIVVKKPVVVSDAAGDAIAIRSMVYLALSYDHRIVDGADAARFLVSVKNRLEGGDFASKLGI